jgi:hypothetical protein
MVANAGAAIAINPAAAVAMSAKRTGVMFLLPIFLGDANWRFARYCLLTAKIEALLSQ